MAPELRTPEHANEIELTPVLSGAQLGSNFQPDEPAKVHVAASMEEYAAEAARDVEKECLYLENAALKEYLLQQQNNMSWLWQIPNEWSQSKEQWGSQSKDQWSSQAGLQLQPGLEVVFQGLQKVVDLNGVHAVIEKWDEPSKRWVVRLSSGEEKFAKPGNLIPAAFSSWSGFCPAYSWQSYAESCEPSQQRASTQGRKSSDSTYTKRASASPRSSLASSNTSSFTSDSTASGPVTSSFSSIGSWEGCEEFKTTVMMRNIPNDYTREMLLTLLDQEGFHGSYDLVYLPIDYHSKVGFGYAFINLVSHAEAERFHSHFTEFAKWDVVSQKVCEVCWSSVLQGVQAHVDRYRNSPVMHEAVRDEFKPALFENGQRVPFPGPTKSIRAPRARRRDSK